MSKYTEAPVGQVDQGEEELNALLSVVPTAVLRVDPESMEIIGCNALAEKLVGCPAEQMVAQPIGAFFDALQDETQGFLAALRSGVDSQEEQIVSLLDARHAPVEVQARTRFLVRNGRKEAFLTLNNLTEIKKAQDALYRHVTFDELTGLVNRRTGLLLLEKEMARSQRDETPLAVLFIDLDGLREVNENHGIAEGDWMIVRAAEILVDSIRMGDEAIRLGADEFLVVLHNCTEDDSHQILQRVEEQMAEAAQVAQKPFALSASIGLAEYVPEKHAQVHQLIAEADRRMYLNKQKKKPSINPGD